MAKFIDSELAAFLVDERAEPAEGVPGLRG